MADAPGYVPQPVSLAPSGHVDPFCREALPPPALSPGLLFTAVLELAYPERLNCVAELLDSHVAAGRGERTAILAPGVRWSYRELWETVNRIAHVLVDDL